MLISSTAARSQTIISKPLKPGEQTVPLGLQYDRTEVFIAVQHTPGAGINRAMP
jgi:hypothetical protein